MSGRSRQDRAERHYSRAPRAVNLGEFELLAVRSAVSPQLAPSLLLRHSCGWDEPLGEKVNGGEVAALAAAHGQLGCES